MDAGAAAKKGGRKGGKGQQAGGAPKKAAAPAKPQQQKKGQAPPQKAKAAAPAKPQQQKKGQAQPQKAKAAAPAPVKQEKKKAAPVKQEKVAEPAPKKAKADEEQKAEVAELSEAAQKELAAIEEQMAEITKEEMKAVAKITREFNAKRKPTLEKRKTATSKIPKFWLQALANTPAAGLITDSDAEIFAYLKDISCIEPTNEEADKDKSDDDFKIVFTFDKNPFFSNKQLWKEVKYSGDAEEVPPTITGSAVNWNKGKNPSEKKTAAPAKEAAGKQKGKRALDAVDEDEDEDDASFFEWFTSSELESVDLGEWFRDKFCPNAVRYFSGDMSDSEDDSDMDDMDSEEEAAFARQFALGGGDDDEDDDEEDGDE
jgi:hypothetical protein